MQEKSFAELGRIQAIRQLFEGSPYKPFGEPFCLKTTEGQSVVSASKLFLEGIDFNLVYFPYKHLGYKCATALAGELYAAFAQPKTLEVTLGISSKLDFAQIEQLLSGIVTAATEHGVEQLSLDLLPSLNGLSISIHACGIRDQKWASTLPEPQSKDLICISGCLGAAFLGQMVLEKKPYELEKYKMMLAAYLKPELSAGMPERLREEGFHPTSCYFVTRGLSDAVKRLTRDCGLGAKVYADKIPFEGNSFSLGKELDIDPISAAMNGGDDYRLMLTLPISEFERFRSEFPGFDIIGHLAQKEVGTVLVSPDGLEHPMSAQGWGEEKQYS